MTSNAPENIPEEPHPAIARPAIKVADDGATAQIRLPSSNIPIADKKTHFMLQNE